jgi:phosphoribosyl 1,2-cyclic phosphodiesterase
MTTIKILGSSSAGNGYIIQSGGQLLIVELGVDFTEYIKALDYDFGSLVGVIATHSHSDHLKVSTLKKMNLASYTVWSTKECSEKYPDEVRLLYPRVKARFGGFIVTALPVPHSVECYAYVIDTPEKERILFYTDLQDFPYMINGVTCIMGEVNYSTEKLIDNMCNGKVSSRPECHLELSKAIAIVRRHWSTSLEKVICLHLSNGNSDENEIRKRFYEELGIRVEIADKGMVINFDEDEF